MPDRITATATRTDPAAFAHLVELGGHKFITDRPSGEGGTDTGPTPQELLAASLASCVAMTIELYAQRKGWELGTIGVTAAFSPANPGSPTAFRLELRLPSNLSPEQRARLETIATHCPVHRLLAGGATFEQHTTLVQG